jgi:hypothetical protein
MRTYTSSATADESLSASTPKARSYTPHDTASNGLPRTRRNGAAAFTRAHATTIATDAAGF